MTSTRDLSTLPDMETLLRRMQSLAVLDAILSPEWDSRYFSFNRRWAEGEQLGSMRDGEGAHFFAWFGPGGCWMKGFDPHASMSPFAHEPPHVAAGVLEQVPGEFVACLREPAFVLEETTFCLWRRTPDDAWQHGPVTLPADEADPDGSSALLAPLVGPPRAYADWAADYHERDVPRSAVEWVFAYRPLDDGTVRALGGRALHDLRADLDEIGYPAAPDDSHP